MFEDDEDLGEVLYGFGEGDSGLMGCGCKLRWLRRLGSIEFGGDL